MIYFWRNMNISSIFYFSKSTSINTQHSSLWETLKMMLFIKYLIKWKRIGRMSWKFWYWFDLISSIELDITKIDVTLVQCPFKQNLLKMSYHFPKLLSFQANFGNFGTRLMKLDLFSHQFKKIWKIWPMFIPVFALNKVSSLYQEADFETHFSGTSPDRPLY